MKLYLLTVATWFLFWAHFRFRGPILRFDTACSSPFKGIGINPERWARTNFVIRKWGLGLLSILLLALCIEIAKRQL